MLFRSFTLHDVVSHSYKKNLANGENNQDGANENYSANNGIEGDTHDPKIIALREQQKRNMLASLFLSQGTPMLLAGDEHGHSNRGNNNVYCQDNEISWIDWRPDDAWLDVYEITKAALRLRREHPVLRQRHWFAGRPTIKGGIKDLV